MEYRLEVEDSFNLICTLFPMINVVRKQKLFAGGKYNWRHLEDVWLGMVLFANLHTCFRGSHSTGKFEIEPAGSECGETAAAAYLHSTNNQLMFSQ